jgi:tetratricopeptide (TPR) repeat protein
LANAERACNDLPAAERVRARGRKLWEAGAPGDLGLLEEAWLPVLEANLRKDQRRFPEALERIDEALALDLTRCRWLQGQIDAGLRRMAEAATAFREVRRVFLEHPLPYDYALVSLDLSLVLLEEGRTAEVREIAEEMLWIFKAQEVHREALAALRLFCEAARQETATVALARRVERFLRRAQLNPALRFEDEGHTAG